MRAIPRACVEVDDINRFNWTTVVVEGRYEELRDDSSHEADRAQRCACFERTALAVSRVRKARPRPESVLSASRWRG